MANSNKKKKPGISSKLKNVPANLDWTETNRNHKNLKRLEKAIQEERNGD